MSDKKQKSIKTALVVAGIYFAIAFMMGLVEQNFIEGLIIGIVGGLIFGSITFLISRSVIKNKVNFKWWQWILYFIGWITGIFNLTFWLIMYVAHLIYDYEEPFFNKKFHQRVYKWGLVMSIVLILIIVLSLFI